LLTGILTGNFAVDAHLPRWPDNNLRKFSVLHANSLRSGTGNSIRRTGNLQIAISQIPLRLWVVTKSAAASDQSVVMPYRWAAAYAESWMVWSATITPASSLRNPEIADQLGAESRDVL
jgi:hypothetical protein